MSSVIQGKPTVVGHVQICAQITQTAVLAGTLVPLEKCVSLLHVRPWDLSLVEGLGMVSKSAEQPWILQGIPL